MSNNIFSTRENLTEASVLANQVSQVVDIHGIPGEALRKYLMPWLFHRRRRILRTPEFSDYCPEIF